MNERTIIVRMPPPPGGKSIARRFQILLGILAVLIIAVPILLVAIQPGHRPPRVVVSKRVVPKTELPPVEPVALQEVTPDDARAINAAVPFSTEPNYPARAFKIFGAVDSQARATDCLAAAVYYEAGDDSLGQKAVAQVILNRVRHPAFPNSVCGVVFQGAERSTGCQFTFTCDGAMVRNTPSAAAWQRARAVARVALDGSVFKPVGLATHYHTDWVVPYWSSSLEKISALHTHLFFRWAGWWGTPAAFARGYAGVEPNIGLMARLSPNHIDLAGLPEGTIPLPLEATALDSSSIPATGGNGLDTFLVTVPKGIGAGDLVGLAVRTCGANIRCKFLAWTEAGMTPKALPMSGAQDVAMSFSFVREGPGAGKALWNCEEFKGLNMMECLRIPPATKSSTLNVPTGTLITPDYKIPSGPKLGGTGNLEPTPTPTPGPLGH